MSDDKQVVELVHDELLHALHGILELGVGGVSPDVGFPHLCGDELGHWGQGGSGRSEGRTSKKSWMTLTWSFTVNVLFAKLLRKLGGGESERRGGRGGRAI